MTKKEMDQYNQAQDRYFAGKATSKDVLKVLGLRRKWESEEKNQDGNATEIRSSY
jgi:hypothetical protein